VNVAGLVELEGCDINQTDCMDNASLLTTAGNGHQGVVQILVERDDVNPDKRDNHSRTHLMCVACNRYEGVVKI